MKVAELIALLMQQDPDAQVLYDGDVSYSPATTVRTLHGSVVIA